MNLSNPYKEKAIMNLGLDIEVLYSEDMLPLNL
jgi:hypothetical protein